MGWCFKGSGLKKLFCLTGSACGIAHTQDATPENVSCLKEGQPVREAFNTVSKYWKSGQVWDGTMEEEADSEEDENNELTCTFF